MHIKKYFLMLILLTSIFFIGCQKQIAQAQINSTNLVEEEIIEEFPPAPLISLEELKNHDSPDSCWVVYEGKIYDITSMLEIHKKPLYEYCGTSLDFESALLKQHGRSKDLKLEEYLIGELV